MKNIYKQMFEAKNNERNKAIKEVKSLTLAMRC